jgi:hypothetical protein
VSLVISCTLKNEGYQAVCRDLLEAITGGKGTFYDEETKFFFESAFADLEKKAPKLAAIVRGRLKQERSLLAANR